MHSIQHLLIYNKCNHMLNIADLNIYLYQKNTFNQVFWLLVTCTHFQHPDKHTSTPLVQSVESVTRGRDIRIADIPGTTTIIDGYKIYSSTVVPARHQDINVFCGVLMVFQDIYELVSIFKKDMWNVLQSVEKRLP